MSRRHTITAANTILQQMPGSIVWKDVNSVYLGGNLAVAKNCGYRYAEDLAGLTDYDIKCKAAEQADTYIQKDTKVMQENLIYRDIGVDHYADNTLKVLYATKKSLKDKHNQVVGIITMMQEITHPRLLSGFFRAVDFEENTTQPKPGLYELCETYPNFNLTKKETTIFYYLLKGKTAKETARILTLSPRTVEHHINTIKYKMQCCNKSQLFEKAHINGFKSVLPINIMLGLMKHQHE